MNTTNTNRGPSEELTSGPATLKPSLSSDTGLIQGSGAVAEASTAEARSEAMSQALTRAFRSLAYPQYRIFWIGNFLSNIGTWLQVVAQGWLVLVLTNSPFLLGLVGFFRALPSLLFSFVGGVIADRLNRRRLLVVTQASMMVVALLLAVLISAGKVHIWHLIVLGFLSGVANALNGPAYQAALPSLVERKEEVQNAVALDSAQFNLSRMIGPSLGGVLLAAWGTAACFYLNALSFVPLLIALMNIRISEAERDRTGSVMTELAEGFRYVGRAPLIFVLLLVLAVLSVFGMPYLVLMPVFARDVLAGGARTLGYLYAAAGIGAVCGSLTLAAIGRPKRRGTFVLVSMTVFSLTLCGFALSKHFALSFFLLIIVGWTMVMSAQMIKTVLQLEAREEMRGRVMSMYFFVWLGFFPIGNLVGGSLANWKGAPFALLLGGFLCLAFSATMLAMISKIRAWIRREQAAS